MLLSEIKILKENVQLPDYLVAYIHEHCQPYLQAVGSDLNYLMYRGISNNRLKRLHEIPELPNCAYIPGHNENRAPRDTQQQYHDTANEVFNETYGVPFRNGLFVTGAEHTAKYYGKPVLVFPIGEFKFCWSYTVRDMAYIAPSNDVPHGKLGIEDFKSILKTAYQTTDLKKAIRMGNEIMLYCDNCLVYTAV